MISQATQRDLIDFRRKPEADSKADSAADSEAKLGGRVRIRIGVSDRGYGWGKGHPGLGS